IGADEGLQEVGILRDVALEARKRQRAVAEAAQEAVRQGAFGESLVGLPQGRGERHGAGQPRAWTTSAMTASPSPRPTEMRTVPSLMPSLARSSAPIRIWVVVAGCVTMLLASPRLLEMSTSFSRFSVSKAAHLPALRSKVTTPPAPDICAMASLCCGWSLRPG